MTPIALHQLRVAVWLGIIIQLGMFWRLIRRQSKLKTLWPLLLRRFAWIAGPATLGIIAFIYRYLAGPDRYGLRRDGAH